MIDTIVVFCITEKVTPLVVEKFSVVPYALLWVLKHDDQ